MEEARDTLMKQISSTSKHQEVLQEELHKVIGETESLSEENAELADQLSPPAFKKQLSVDPFDLDEGEWRVRYDASEAFRVILRALELLNLFNNYFNITIS